MCVCVWVCGWGCARVHACDCVRYCVCVCCEGVRERTCVCFSMPLFAARAHMSTCGVLETAGFSRQRAAAARLAGLPAVKTETEQRGNNSTFGSLRGVWRAVDAPCKDTDLCCSARNSQKASLYNTSWVALLLPAATCHQYAFFQKEVFYARHSALVSTG